MITIKEATTVVFITSLQNWIEYIWVSLLKIKTRREEAFEEETLLIWIDKTSNQILQIHLYQVLDFGIIRVSEQGTSLMS